MFCIRMPIPRVCEKQYNNPAMKNNMLQVFVDFSGDATSKCVVEQRPAQSQCETSETFRCIGNRDQHEWILHNKLHRFNFFRN